MNGLLIAVYYIVAIVAGMVTIVAGIKGIFREFRKKELFRISYFTGFLIICLVGIFFLSYFIVSSFKEETKETRMLAQSRYEITKVRDELWFNILGEYTQLLENPTQATLADTVELMNKAADLYKKTFSFSDSRLDLGLTIFKHDYLCYSAVIVASLERNSTRAIEWANTSISAAQKAFKLISDVNKKHLKMSDDDVNKLLLWIEEDNVENRLYYLWAWALAIKLLNEDEYITPKMIEDKIDKISLGTYLVIYELDFNYHFKKLEDQFSEKFHKAYFD